MIVILKSQELSVRKRNKSLGFGRVSSQRRLFAITTEEGI